MSMKTQTNHGGRTVGNTLRYFGISVLGLAVIEVVLCFVGPLAFLQKPNLVLFPLHSSTLTGAEVEEVDNFLERQLTLTRSYAVVSHRFIVEYFVRTNPDFDRAQIEELDFKSAQVLAKKLGLRRFALGWVYNTSTSCDLYIAIWDPTGDTALLRTDFSAPDLQSLLRGVGTDGRPLEFQKKLSAPTKGLGPADMLVLLVFGLQAWVGIVFIVGRQRFLFLEIVWAALSILFLFNFIYATNANMDYMQRYIATTGQLRLAINTTAERMEAVARYVPSLLLLGLFWLLRGRTLSVPFRLPEAKWFRLGRLRELLPRLTIPLTLISAALFALSFPSAVSLEGAGPLAWISLVPVLFVIVTADLRRAIFCGVYFGIMQGLFINYWHGTYDYISLHMISITIVVEYLLFMVPLILLARASGKWGFILVPLAWVLFDWLRTTGMVGYPWGIAATSQYRFLPLIQIASVTGIWGIDFLVVLINSSLAWMFAAPFTGWRWSPTTASSRVGRRIFAAGLPAIASGALLFVSIAAGTMILLHVRSRLTAAQPDGPITVALIQPNCDPRKNPYTDSLDRLYSLTDQAVASIPGKPDLVVWPEGAFMLDIREWTDPDRADSYWGKIVAQFLDYQRGLGTWLLTGTQDHGFAKESGKLVAKNFNSSILLGPDGQRSPAYHKIHLVPFGEHFPLDKTRFAALYSMFKTYEISDWGVGDSYSVFSHPDADFSTPICFEDVFPDGVRRYVLGGAQMIVNISNDYWSLNPVEGRQHGIFALFRAVENRRPLLRSTESGYTVSIDPTGRIEAGAPDAYTEGYLMARVSRARFPLTIYTRFGDWFPQLSGLLIAAIAIAMIGMRLHRWMERRRTVLTAGEQQQPAFREEAPLQAESSSPVVEYRNEIVAHKGR